MQCNGYQDNFGKISMKMVKFRSWKTFKSRGNSWNFKSLKEYEPWKGELAAIT